MPATSRDLPATLKLLSDPVRLRLCAVLSRAELAVQELVAVTGLAQSRISNHLALLRRSGLVRDRREGSWSFHSLVAAGSRGPLTPELHEAVIEAYCGTEAGQRDLEALETLREQRRARSRRTHDALAERWAELGQEFALGSLRSEVLARALPAEMVCADLGCGAGYLTAALAERCSRVIAVDHSARMLAAARRRRLGARVDLRRGELDNLPLRDGEVDAAFANLVWHHLPDLDRAARELFRVLKPGGTAVISDLLPHEQDWMRERMGDLRLGLEPRQVVAALARAGLKDPQAVAALDRYRVEAPGGTPVELPMFLVRAVRPAPETRSRLRTFRS
jgi:ArsR family transcriptional regulator